MKPNQVETNTETCLVCDSARLKRGLCSKHYQEFLRRKDSLPEEQQHQSKAWIDAAVRQASEHTDMACSGIDRFREVELLRRKIDVEYLQFSKEFPPPKKRKERIDKPITKWVRTHRHKYDTNKKAVEAYIELYGGSLEQLYEIDLKNDLRQNPLPKPKKSD